MQRDLELIRELLLYLEEADDGTSSDQIELDDRRPDEVQEHVRLLLEAGLIEGVDVCTPGGSWVYFHRLTWVGHELLDAARNPERWGRALRIVDDGGGMTMAAVQKLLTDLALVETGTEKRNP